MGNQEKSSIPKMKTYKYLFSNINNMLAVYIPCKNKKEATRISQCLLEKKLIACANLIPLNSLYIWKGKLTSTKEIALLAKTIENKFAAIEKEATELHSYHCPCITSWKIEKVNAAYEQWVKEMVGE